jgi:hypothetical protein
MSAAFTATADAAKASFVLGEIGRAVPGRLIGVLAAAFLSAIAACGGEEHLSREELISAADAICAETEERLDDLGTRFVEEGPPILMEANEELADLRPPADLDEAYDEWIAARRKEEDLLATFGEITEEGGQDRTEDILLESGQAKEEATDRARELGLDACARG